MNNKKNNRKGFTIVELVIVIAVIAILATVLVPTFGNIIEKANISAAKQEAKSIHTNYVMKMVEDKADYETDCYVVVDGYYIKIVNGGVTDEPPVKTEPTKCYKLLENNSVTVKEITGCNATDCAKTHS